MSGGAVDKLGGTGMCGGCAIGFSKVDVTVEVVIIAVDVADDACGAVVIDCDIDCDVATEGEVSVEEMVGLDSMHWNEVGLWTLG